MAIELYVVGPQVTAYRWNGVCEYDTETQQYMYHPKWPQRSITGLMRPASPIAELVRDGFWMRYQYHPELQLPEGL